MSYGVYGCDMRHVSVCMCAFMFACVCLNIAASGCTWIYGVPAMHADEMKNGGRLKYMRLQNNNEV